MVIGTGIILAVIVAVFAVYFGARRILGAEADPHTRELSSSIIFRVSALHGLVLALVFASEVVEYQALEFESAHEVNALSDLYYDAARYGGDAIGVQSPIREYLEIMLSEEWESLGRDGELSPEAWTLWDSTYEIVLNLEPASPRQEALRENMLRKVHRIGENRDLREYHAKSTLSAMFWAAAIVGVLLTAAGYYAFPPRRANLVLLGIFAGYTGLIIFTIYAMSNPFSAPAALQPMLFTDLLSEFESMNGEDR